MFEFLRRRRNRRAAGQRGPKALSCNLQNLLRLEQLEDRAMLSVTPGGGVSQWNFNGTSNVAIDDLGQNNGVLNGGTGRTTGFTDGAILFDGVNDFVTVPDSDTLDLSSELTVEVWAKFDRVGNQYDSLVTKVDSNQSTWEVFSLRRARTGLQDARAGKIFSAVVTDQRSVGYLW